MIIQIFGTLKCKDTKKAVRFFKERNIQTQFVDLKIKGLSQGELNSVKSKVGIENLIDTESKEYENNNLQYMKFNIEEKLLENPLLFKTPILRSSFGVTVGHEPNIWKDWATKSKS